MERDTTSSKPTEDELERFRQEWQQELQQQRKNQQNVGSQSKTNGQGVPSHAVAQKVTATPLGVGLGPGPGTGSTLMATSPPRTFPRNSDFDSPRQTRTHDRETDLRTNGPPRTTSPKSPKKSLAPPHQHVGNQGDAREHGRESLINPPSSTGPPTSTPRAAGLSAGPSSSPLPPSSLTSASTSTSTMTNRPPKDPKGKRALKTAQAVEQYANAVELEQMGRLNEALQLYRGAYKLDAQVEKSYHTWVMEQEANLLQGIEEIQLTDPKQSIAGSLSDVKDDVYTFRTTVQLDRDYVPVTSSIVEDPSEGTSTARALTTRKQAGRGVAGESAPASIEGQGVVGPSGTSTPIEPGIGDRNDPLTRILLSWLETAREEILHPPPMDPSSSQLVPTSPFTSERLPENIHDLYHHLPLLPLDEKYPILLSALPEEILENVVEFMDVTTLERFALVCKRLRVLTRGVGKWRTLCRQIYRPPILPPELPLSTLVKRHGMDYRTTFLEERRVRYDGVYISVCHYIRPGQSELAWVNITHLITYHRFLRFYPDGTVIALLTTDHPVDVVHNIKPSLRAKGTLFGRWSLSDWDPDMEKDRPPFPVNELDPAWPPNSRTSSAKDPHASAGHPSSSPHAINLISISDMIEPGVTHPKYTFEMNLELRSAQRGRWNKLVMRDYQSVRLGTGEALGLSLKHQKPFFFSKVRSYSNTL